jgi:hypothetical protein
VLLPAAMRDGRLRAPKRRTGPGGVWFGRGFFSEENVEACKQGGVKSARNRLARTPISLWTDRPSVLRKSVLWPWPDMAIDRSNLRWAKDGVEWALYCHGRKEPLLHVIRDAHYPEMIPATEPDAAAASVEQRILCQAQRLRQFRSRRDQATAPLRRLPVDV